MKTNVILRSSDRDLFGVTIRQNTKKQMLSVNDLHSAYEKARFIHGWGDRPVQSIMRTNEFQERCFYVLQERDLVNMQMCTFIEMLKKEGVTKSLKGLGVWNTTGKGANRMTVADPYIWVLLAMEMNPMIYAKVVIWLTDSLIFDRIEAGDEFMPMNSAIKGVLKHPNYPMYAKLINEKVFDKHMRGIRNLASSKELRKIADIEKFVTNSISMGIIKNEDQLKFVIKNYN